MTAGRDRAVRTWWHPELFAMASQQEPLSVFVSYRRTDRPGHAGRVGDALRRSFGNDHVLDDVAPSRHEP